MIKETTPSPSMQNVIRLNFNICVCSIYEKFNNESKVGVIYVFFHVTGLLMSKIIEHDFCTHGFGHQLFGINIIICICMAPSRVDKLKYTIHNNEGQIHVMFHI